MSKKPNTTVILPLSMDYTVHWSVGEALRELIANQRDGAGHDPEKCFTSMTEDTGRTHASGHHPITLKIGNLSSEPLKERILVLGASSKRDENEQSIGRFGEGAKVAICVLAREEIDISCRNYRDLWQFEFRENKDYGCKVLHVDIYRDHFPDDGNGLIEFTLENVQNPHIKMMEFYLLDSFLKTHEQLKGEPIEKLDFELGEYFPDVTGEVFVGGIRIRDAEVRSPSVNLLPNSVTLDRERRAIPSDELENIETMVIRQFLLESASAKVANFTETHVSHMDSIFHRLQRDLRKDDLSPYEKETASRQLAAIEAAMKPKALEIKKLLDETSLPLVLHQMYTEEATRHGKQVMQVSTDDCDILEMGGIPLSEFDNRLYRKPANMEPAKATAEMIDAINQYTDQLKALVGESAAMTMACEEQKLREKASELRRYADYWWTA